MPTTALDIAAIRAEFPALRSGSTFLDNPGGTQVPQTVIDAVSHYLSHENANLGGAFRTSTASDQMMSRARGAAADLVGGKANEIVFGQNMTSLSFHLARSLAKSIRPGDEIVVTRMDHDANISPWTTMAEDVGASVRWVDFDPAHCTLHVEQFKDLITSKTRLVAIGYASNAVGTINPVAEICAAAREAGALSFVDAVQYAPHGCIDVEQLGCDFLACSAYKFFGPHVGILWGRHELLESLTAYKVRPSKNSAPDKFETGTLNHEGIAGTTAAIDYLADLTPANEADSRRLRLERSFRAIEDYEREACKHLLETLDANPKVAVYGLTDLSKLDQRVPTVSITVEGKTPSEVAATLAKDEIFVWDGDYYAVDVIRTLGLQESGGMVRIGLAHYNTHEEIDLLARALEKL